MALIHTLLGDKLFYITVSKLALRAALSKVWNFWWLSLRKFGP